MNGLPEIRNLGNGCSGCSVCAAVCPVDAITMASDAAGFRRPAVNEDVCIRCGRCDRTCPSLNPGETDTAHTVRWMQSKNREDLKRSSSGAVFSLLAEHVLKVGGIVCGASLSDDAHGVRHVLVEGSRGLEALKGSKYVQSEIDKEIYRNLSRKAKCGQTVLFSGTPCQVAGFNNYLGKVSQLPNVFSVAVICHGVPSPLLWKKYLDCLEKDSEAHGIKDVQFRNKDDGWERFRLVVDFSGDEEKTFSEPFGENWFMKSFLRDACLRSNCFECSYKRTNGSDLIIGDFWGFDARKHGCPHPDLGVSAVIANSDKGEQLLAGIESGCLFGEATYQEVLAGNPALTESPRPFSGRNDFMRDLVEGVPIKEMINTWSFEPTMVDVIARKAWSAIRRIRRLVK